MIKANRRSSPDGVTRVLHVAESFGGGVASAIRDYVASTPELEHSLLYATRADAPLTTRDFVGLADAVEMPRGHLSRIRFIRDQTRNRMPAILHAHSSFGGGYARLARSHWDIPIVYTPHCFAYERRDVGRLVRTIIRSAESLLARNTSVIAACSPREAQLAKASSRTPVVYVPNITPVTDVRRRHRYSNDRPLRILGSGRAAAQKDPAFFMHCVSALRDSGIDLEATWVGGDDTLRGQAEDAGVKVTGWLSREKGLELLTAADLYLHTAAWEGFPVAVLEAAHANVPTLVRSIPAFEGLGLPSFTSEVDLVQQVKTMNQESALDDLRAKSARALAAHTPEAQRASLLEAYATAIDSAQPANLGRASEGRTA